jgi:hypothetical protein
VSEIFCELVILEVIVVTYIQQCVWADCSVLVSEVAETNVRVMLPLYSGVLLNTTTTTASFIT